MSTTEHKTRKTWISLLLVLLFLAVSGWGSFAYVMLFGASAQPPAASQTEAPLSLAPKTGTDIPIIPQAPNTPLLAIPGKQVLPPPFNAPTPLEAYSCTDPLGCVKIDHEKPIHIAYLLSVSGYNAPLGIDAHRGVELAIDDSHGEILGTYILFDGVNDECSGEQGIEAAEKLISDPTIVAVIGPSCSWTDRTAEPLLSNAGFVTISPSNTEPDLTDPTSPNHYPGYFRTAPNDYFQGAAAAEFAYNFLGLRTAATIHDGSAYAVSMQQSFADNFKKLGGTITMQTSVIPGQTDMSEVLASIAVGKPELLYFPIFLPEGAYLIQQAKTTPGLENSRLLSADSMYFSDVAKTTGDAIEGVMVTGLLVHGPAYDAFVQKYQAKYGELPINIFHAHAYDAYNIIEAAIEKVAILTPDHTLYIPRQALRDAVAATRDFQGVTGVLTCSPSGDCANPIIGVHVYHAGQFPPELIWPTKYVNP